MTDELRTQRPDVHKLDRYGAMCTTLTLNVNVADVGMVLELLTEHYDIEVNLSRPRP